MSGRTGDRSEERPALDREDARLVARLRDAWAPEPLSPARRAAFDAAVQERLERARRARWLAPALGAGLVAASLGLLVLVRAPAPAPPLVAGAGATVEERAAWAADLVYAGDDDAGEREADDESLPPEYAAIAGVFVDR